jgi:hypothetical protein
MAQFQVDHAPLADGSVPDIGTRAEIRQWLAPYNVAPETDDPAETILYGPGIRVEFHDADPVTRFMLSEVDTDISHRVLIRIAKDFNWVLTDINTGTQRRLFRPSPAEGEE